MKNTKEAVKEMSEFVNNMSCPIDEFIEGMANEHRTLQQTFTNLCLAWIRKCAENHSKGNFDGRNLASCEVSRQIVETVEDAKYDCPFI